MKFQSKINYVQECVAVLSNAAGGEYDLARELQTDTLPEDCRKDLELLSQIQREAVEGLSKENIEFYFKPLDNARTCVASLLGRFHVIHALDELEEEEAFFDTLTLSERLNARCEDTKAPIDEKLVDFTDYMKSLQMEDGMRWQLLSALFHPQEHKKRCSTCFGMCAETLQVMKKNWRTFSGAAGRKLRRMTGKILSKQLWLGRVPINSAGKLYQRK